MTEWQQKQFAELGQCIRGVSYKPENLREASGKKAVTLLRSNNIRGGRLNFRDLQFVDVHTVRADQILQDADIAICMSNGNRALVGKAGQFNSNDDGLQYTVGAFCSIFRPDSEFDLDFVRHQFGSPFYQKQLDRILAGSAINNLTGSDVNTLVALCPQSRAEQSKIAEILSTVDRAIEQTEALIVKQQRIKTGLMQDLLTRGIDEQGNLRSEQTHKFKDSPLGRIPEEWDDTVTFDDATPNDAPICYGIVQPGGFDFNGVKVAGIYTLNSSFRDWHMSSKEIEKAYGRSRIEEGDVLLSVKGSTGRVGVVPKGEAGNISRDIARIRPIAEFDSHYIRILLSSAFFQRYLANAEVGTTRAELSIKIIRELLLLKPPLEEQRKVVRIVLQLALNQATA